MAQPLLHSAYSMSIPPFTPFTPAAFGRSSSPLNPHASSDAHPPSSSPMTSPTPLPAALGSHYGGYGGYGRAASSEAGPSSLPKPSNPTPTFMSLYTPTSRPKRPSPSSRQSLPSRSLRPTAPGALSSPPGRPKTGTGSPADIFSDPSHTGVGGVGASGTSPLEGQMWRDRLDRRMTERDRRQRARRDDMAERRGTGEGVKEADRRLGLGQRSRTGVRAEVLGGEEDEELERQQAADDEEIYRRLMLLQQRKAAHAALVSFERETGGSDPLLPEFWEDEEFDTPPDPLTPNGYNAFETPPRTSSSSRPHLPLRDPRHDTHMSRGGRHADMEAALRAAAEAEAAEAELAEQIEREMAAQMPSRAGSEYGYGVDGDGDGDMDMEGIDWAQVEQMERLALQGQTGQSRGHAERSGASHAGGTDVEMD